MDNAHKAEKAMERLESNIDQFLEKVFAHPVFLGSVSTALNLNSYRKIWMNRTLTAAWKFLQLPNKRDQERTLFLINELHHRIGRLEAKLDVESRSLVRKETPGLERQLPRKKTAMGQELVSIQ